MRRGVISTVTPSLLVLFFGVLFARDMQTFEKTVPADPGVKRMHLQADFGAAELRLSSHDDEDLVSARVRYNADRVETAVEYEKSGDDAELSLSSRQVRRKLDVDADDAIWRLSMSTACRWDIDLDLGAGETDMDLSGLPIEKFLLDFGASECRVAFTRPSPIPLEQARIDAGAGDVEIVGLGYTSFRLLDVDCGAGEFLLNFEGLGDGRHDVEIDVGIGSIRIEVPPGYPVRVEVDEGWFKSVDVRGIELDKVDGGVFESPDYASERDRLTVTLSIGMGEVIITAAD